MSRVSLRPLIRSLPAAVPFVGPEAIERRLGRVFEVRVGANESAFGISPAAARAMRDAVEQISWYGDPECYELRDALARRHGVGVDQVCVAAGIDELLGLVVRMLIEEGAPVVSSYGAYPTFNFQVAGFGGRLQTVPYRDEHEDPEALVAAARRSGAPLVYLANPDNPMGTWHDGDTILAAVQALPPNCVLILDEAYLDFAPAAARVPIETDDPRVIRMRTFSKAHGMAGARVGYALAAAEVIQALDKIRNHFAVNRIAQAGALASLEDHAFLDSVVGEVAAGREAYYAMAQRLGMRPVPSATNFVALDTGSGGRARRLLETLERLGVFVRMPGVEPLDRYLRITVGTAAERTRVADVLATALAEVDRGEASP